MKKKELHVISVLCFMFLVVCLMSLLGISLNQKKDADGDKRAAGDVKEALECVNSSIEEDAPKIALTFDDGPSSQCTGRLLDGLQKRDVKATFFLIGKNAKENPELVKRLDEEGHLIGNHTYNHVEITRL